MIAMTVADTIIDSHHYSDLMMMTMMMMLYLLAVRLSVRSDGYQSYVVS